MQKTLRFGSAVLLSIATAAQADTRSRAIDEMLDRASFEGVVIASDRAGMFHARAVGLANRSDQTPHAIANAWRWASVTKQLTAVLVMQNVDAGRLTLDTTLAEALPAFSGRDATRITIRNLLQHTSGLPNPDQTPVDLDGVPSFYSGAFAAGDTWCSGTPRTEPGASFDYNNCDYLLLGRILERLDRQPFDVLVRRQFSTAWGLHSVTVVDADTVERSPVVGYQRDGKPVARISLATFGAAGAIEGSPADMLAFDRALIDGKLLSNESREAMWTGEPKFGYAALGAWAFPAALKGCKEDTRLIERRGEIGGIQVRNFIARDNGVALAMFSNSAATDFGEVWMGKGLSYDVLSAALCVPGSEKTPAPAAQEVGGP